MLDRPIITLTTDFGLKDPFVGIMKGVILGINPKAEIIDISHNITPQNIFEAAQILSMGYKYFPPTTIHVVVVDPQVGGARRPILVATQGHYFIGPDNGVFTLIYEEEHVEATHITSSHYYFPPKGPTFHGRDIFAPAAAWLSKGIEISKFGQPINDYVTLPMAKSRLTDKATVEGEVIYIDIFGNAITNITKDDLDKLNPEFSKEKFKVTYKENQLSLSNYYAETEGSNLSGVLNSFGFVELFIYKGNASERFNIKIGDGVSVTLV
jgi:S-adenosylmethionine hydrolase